MKRKLITAGIILVGLWACANALAVTSEHTTTNGLVAVSNRTSTAEWKPQAVFVLYPSATTGTVTLTRTARGVTVPLARHSFTNAASVTWLPETDYPIRPGDVLVITSTVRSFTAQIERSQSP